MSTFKISCNFCDMTSFDDVMTQKQFFTQNVIYYGSDKGFCSFGRDCLVRLSRHRHKNVPSGEIPVNLWLTRRFIFFFVIIFLSDFSQSAEQRFICNLACCCPSMIHGDSHHSRRRLTPGVKGHGHKLVKKGW